MQFANSTVEVSFVEDKLPRFDNLPRIQVVSENADLQSSVYRVRSRDDDEQARILKGNLNCSDLSVQLETPIFL